MAVSVLIGHASLLKLVVGIVKITTREFELWVITLSPHLSVTPLFNLSPTAYTTPAPPSFLQPSSCHLLTCPAFSHSHHVFHHCLINSASRLGVANYTLAAPPTLSNPLHCEANTHTWTDKQEGGAVVGWVSHITIIDLRAEANWLSPVCLRYTLPLTLSCHYALPHTCTQIHLCAHFCGDNEVCQLWSGGLCLPPPLVRCLDLQCPLLKDFLFIFLLSSLHSSSSSQPLASPQYLVTVNIAFQFKKKKDT